MVKAPFFDKNGVKKGAWSKEEDDQLRAYILKYGHWNWRELPKFAGLSRCGKSCRLRWMNYLRPGVKHGNYSKEEEDLIAELHDKLGNKWSRIAANLPGRTDNEIKNFWHTHLKKRRKESESSSGFEEKLSKKQNNQVISENRDLTLIFESYPLSPESSNSNEFSNSVSDSAMVTASSTSSNWNIAEDEHGTVFGTFENCSEDFWTQPFVADQDAYRLPLPDHEGFVSSYYNTSYEYGIDLVYQVMKEFPGN